MKGIYMVYGILHKKFSDKEMRLLLTKAFKMKSSQFFKYYILDYGVEEKVFTKTHNPLLLTLANENINLLSWVVDKVEFTTLNPKLKAVLFHDLIPSVETNHGIIRYIIGRLNISTDDINLSEYCYLLAGSNVQRAIQLINLFTPHREGFLKLLRNSQLI